MSIHEPKCVSQKNHGSGHEPFVFAFHTQFYRSKRLGYEVSVTFAVECCFCECDRKLLLVTNVAFCLLNMLDAVLCLIFTASLANFLVAVVLFVSP